MNKQPPICTVKISKREFWRNFDKNRQKFRLKNSLKIFTCQKLPCVGGFSILYLH